MNGRDFFKDNFKLGLTSLMMKFLPNGEDRNANYGTPRIKSPKEMIDYVHKQNAHIMISVWASFGPWTEMYQKMDSLKALLHFETWPPKAGVKPYRPGGRRAGDDHP